MEWLLKHRHLVWNIFPTQIGRAVLVSLSGHYVQIIDNSKNLFFFEKDNPYIKSRCYLEIRDVLRWNRSIKYWKWLKFHLLSLWNENASLSILHGYEKLYISVKIECLRSILIFSLNLFKGIPRQNPADWPRAAAMHMLNYSEPYFKFTATKYSAGKSHKILHYLRFLCYSYYVLCTINYWFVF